MQHVVVGLIVVAALAYAVWTLVPAVRRRFGSNKGAGCGGCDSCGPAPRMEDRQGVPEQPIRIVRR